MENTISVSIKNGVPKIILNGKKFYVVSFSYHYYTKTEACGSQQLIATGYIENSHDLINIFCDLITGKTTVQ